MLYAGLEMSLQLECQYLQRIVLGVGVLMGPIELALREEFFPTLFGKDEVNDGLRELLVHGVKRGEIGIPDPRKSEDWGYEMSVEACEVLVESLLGGVELNCVGHWSCIRKSITRARKAG